VLVLVYEGVVVEELLLWLNGVTNPIHASSKKYA
jgi:hypothetical protein